MIRKALMMVAILAIAVGLVSCSTKRQTIGVLAGTAAGVAIGAVAGGTGGAIVGGAAGAMAGGALTQPKR